MAEHLANHDEPPDRDDGWQDLAVANPTFLLERLGSECGDLQFLRELTVNGLDAIAAQPGPAQRSRGLGPGLAAPRGLRRQGAQADGDRHRHRHAPRPAWALHQPARLQQPRAIPHRQLRRRRQGRRRIPQPPRTRIPLLAPGPRLAGVLQATPRRPLGTRTPTLAGRPHRLLATTRRAGQALAAARPGSRHPGRAARPARAPRHHPGAGERHRRPPALDHPLPQRPLPAPPHASRGARPRATRPRASPDSCSTSTASNITSSDAPSQRVPWS